VNLSAVVEAGYNTKPSAFWLRQELDRLQAGDEAKKQLFLLMTQNGEPVFVRAKLKEIITKYKSANQSRNYGHRHRFDGQDLDVNKWWAETQMEQGTPSPPKLRSQGPPENSVIVPLPRTPDKQYVEQLLPSYNGVSYSFTPVVLMPQGDEFRQELPTDYGPTNYGPVRHSNTRNLGTHVPLTASVYKRFSRQRPGNSLGMVLAARKKFLEHVHEASTLT
jgi:hypothetical protein